MQINVCSNILLAITYMGWLLLRGFESHFALCVQTHERVLLGGLCGLRIVFVVVDILVV